MLRAEAALATMTTERDTALAATTTERDSAYAKGVEDGKKAISLDNNLNRKGYQYVAGKEAVHIAALREALSHVTDTAVRARIEAKYQADLTAAHNAIDATFRARIDAAEAAGEVYVYPPVPYP